MTQTQTKIIRRYQNRKLYDTETSSYVTLNKVVEAIVSGRDVQVVDNVTKADTRRAFSFPHIELFEVCMRNLLTVLTSSTSL